MEEVELGLKYLAEINVGNILGNIPSRNPVCVMMTMLGGSQESLLDLNLMYWTIIKVGNLIGKNLCLNNV